METTVVDHILLLVLAVVAPILGFREYRKLVAAVEAGRPDPRVPVYRKSLFMQWGLTLALLIYWVSMGRALETLGLAFKIGAGPGIGLGLTLAVVVFLVLQLKVLTKTDDKLERVRPQMDTMRPMLPHDGREARWFNALSVTAGICEELLYRGFLMAYFGALFGVWPAVALSCVVFGLGHAYQGARGIVKTGIVGAVMAGLFVLTGSLWAPMLLHAVMDLTSGHLGRSVIERLPASPVPSAS
jgi:membrane protease YdiL (CAAX protease family)